MLKRKLKKQAERKQKLEVCSGVLCYEAIPMLEREGAYNIIIAQRKYYI
jgi:hypothetical protein